MHLLVKDSYYLFFPAEMAGPRCVAGGLVESSKAIIEVKSSCLGLQVYAVGM